MPTSPVNGAFVGACMLFAPSSMIKDIPYDPYLYFFGEEISLSARLWTSGYEIFHPQRTVVWHDWDRSKRPTHFSDHPDWTKLNEMAYARVRYLLGTELNTDGQVIKQLDKYGLGSERSLVEYQEYCGIDFAMKTISDFAREANFDPNRGAAAKQKREEKDAAAQTAMRDRKHDGPLPRILVMIPSYRDPDCQNSVKDLFDKANHPERIFVSICWQYLMDGTDDDCFVVPYPYPDQVREHKVDALGSRGMCWARWMTQQMWEGEEFVLSVDAHMRFEPGWDDIIIDVWKNCDNPKAMLSVHPPKFDPPDKLSRGYVHGMSAAHFNSEGILMILGKPPYPIDKAPEKPMPGAIIGDGFLFGPSSWIHDVPFDQHLYFFGQEITVAVRLWTNGYDIYHPNKLVMYHDYGRPNRKHHSRDNTDGHSRNQRSFARVRHMLGTELSTDPEVLFEIDQYGLGTVRSLAEYEEYSGVDFKKKTIAEFAFEGRYNHYSDMKGMPKLTPAEVLEVKEPLHSKPFRIMRNNTIFVNIASYRDPECQHTIKDLFEKANNPGRIYVGVCWQFDPNEDHHCFEVDTRRNQVRIRAVDWRDAEGVCWARYQAQQLWDQEEYVLMIDSHMRFVPGWDDLMIAELNECGAMKPMLSCSPASYTPPNNLSRHMNPTIRRVRPFMPDGNLRCQGESLDHRPEKPLNAAFMVANFAFSRAEVLAEVPYDPFLYFDQEEITYAARLYTHGWDIFSARQQFLYHFYNDVKAPGGSVRPLHWRDLRQADEGRIKYLKDRGLKRFNHLTGYKLSDEADVVQRLDEFGWGRVRPLEQFEEYSGVDFKNKVTSEKALRCWFIPDLAKYRERPIVIPEIDQQKRAVGQAGGAVAVAGNPMHPEVVQGGPAQTMQQVGLQAPQAGHFQAVQSQHAGRPTVSLVSMQDKPHGDANKAANANDIPAELIKNAPVTLLEKGDYLPMFELPDYAGKKVYIERFGGKHILAYFLPADDMTFLATLFKHLQDAAAQNGLSGIWEWFVLDTSIEQAGQIKKQLNITQLVLADPDRKVARSLGICQQGDKRITPTGFVINQNLKIVERFVTGDPVQLAHEMVRTCAQAVNAFTEKNAQPRIITEMAPALIVPDVFSAEFSEKCIKSFRTGHTFDGTVGAEKGKAYRPEAKIRMDHIPSAALTAEIDDKLSRSLFPEIKKIFGVDVRFREQYKIGLYSGDKKGFFIAHRDNYDNPLGYRRLAMTLHLTDDFEGGGLRFPEYGGDIYRPTRGSAITFSCATLHEALPVTKGDRFVLVGFFHGEEEDKYRRHYMLSKGHPINQRDFVPTLRQYPELRLSRAFYDEWQQERGAQAAAPLMPYGTLDVREHKANLDKTQLTSVGTHTPTKVYESKSAVVLDNFLPDNIYTQLHQHMQRTDYQYINTDKVSRAWHIQDGFPLRSQTNAFYYADPTIKPEPGHMVYPSNTVFDPFIEHILAVQPNVNHIIGQKSKDWWHFSVSGWLYPPGTGLALHEDGSGVYSGAYVYFLNPTWKPHWGGQLLLLEDQSNDNMRKYQKESDRMDVYKSKWMHANRTDDIIMDDGLAQCVFPKGNRIVFIASDAYHMVTRVNEQAGDNLRMSLAGFFVTSKEPIISSDTKDYG
jgi:Rps23 Pro-64 3,4-dihydroxylase Tpa1-like proline 4-hydroxylase/peroxiredoxin/GT2 family glycosyltransferase